MRPDPHVARDISYAHAAHTRGGRLVIRTLENLTGRIGLIRRADGYEAEVAAGRDFWQVMLDRYGLSLSVMRGALSDIPRSGPLVLVANHPYGILDGLIMGYILRQTRGDFRILANSVFRKADALNRIVLPVRFDQTRAAMADNLATRKAAVDYLRAGGAIGIFPGGTVSTAQRPMMQPMDPSWRGFTARMIAKSDATVVPIFFEGHNSRLFQIASHMHQTLRLGLLIKEFGARVDTDVRLAVGQALGPAELAPFANETKRLMEFLRHRTYELSPGALDPDHIGFDFE